MSARSRTFLCLCQLLCLAARVRGQNVAMTSAGVAVAVRGGSDFALSFTNAATGERQQDSAIADARFAFDDVAVDPANERLVFALATASRAVCAFVLGGPDGASPAPAGCVVGTFAVAPFCGVAARGGTLVVSGGTGGFTAYEYDPATGVIADEPALRNVRLPDVIGHPDVVMVDAARAALSTDFRGGASRFGTQLVLLDLAGEASASAGADYRVADTLGFDLIIGPANFPLVNAVYRTADGRTVLYTANGAMQAQDLAAGGAGAVLAGAPAGFAAVTVAVHQARGLVAFGGVVAAGGGSRVLFYDLGGDPLAPALVASRAAGTGERITSVAAGGNLVAFVTTENADVVQTLELPPASKAGKAKNVKNGKTRKTRRRTEENPFSES